MSEKRHLALDPAAAVALPSDALERRAAEAHAHGCPECARALRQGERLLELLDENLAVPAPAEQVLEAVKASVRRRLAMEVAAPAAGGSLAMAALLIALASVPVDTSRALGAAALAAIGAALTWWAASGRARAALGAAAGASALFALSFASGGAAAPPDGLRCATIELIPAAAGLAAVLLRGRSGDALKRDRLGTLALLATGLLSGQAAQLVACPAIGGPLHALIFHSGALLALCALAVMLALADRRQRAGAAVAASPGALRWARGQSDEEGADSRPQLRWRARWTRAVGGAVVAAATAAALLVVPRPVDQRLKGGAVGLLVHRKRGEQVRVLDSRDRIQAGDALRISLSVASPMRAAVWFVDARGRVDSLLPGGQLELRAGEQTVGGSVVVDRPCLDLWVVVAGGKAAEGAGEALRHVLSTGPPSGDDWLPAGAVARRLECE